MKQDAEKRRRCASLDVVVPVFNEEQVLPLLWQRLRPVLEGVGRPCRVIFVDDGSRDSSLEWLFAQAEQDRRVGVLAMSRNFGHQAAITAGLAWAGGDAVVIMDADLQDPPELISSMLAEYEKGFDVVYAQRRVRKGETVFKKLTADVFYRLMCLLAGDRYPRNVGDFRLMSRDVVRAINGMREYHRFLRGMVAWVGFSQTALLFDREERAAGRTKYGVFKMLRFAWAGLTSFSAVPVRSGLLLGALVMLWSILYGISVLYAKFVLHQVVPGWTSLVLLQLAFSGLIFLYLGIIGDYVGRVYEEGKGRPLYIVQSVKNLKKNADEVVDR